MASNGELQNENHRWPKRTKRLILYLQKKKHFGNPQNFGENILWTDVTNAFCKVCVLLHVAWK